MSEQTPRKMILLNLNTETDADVLGKLASVRNKQGYIKMLIRQDMKRHQIRKEIDERLALAERYF